VTFANLSKSGKIPVSKLRFASLESHTEKKSLNFLSKNTGTLLGPGDFFSFKFPMISNHLGRRSSI
jgi:hypothetical protein